MSFARLRIPSCHKMSKNQRVKENIILLSYKIMIIKYDNIVLFRYENRDE